MKTWIYLTLFGAAGCLISPVAAQDRPATASASASTGAPASISELESALDAIRAKYELPALGGAIVEGDRVLAVLAVGRRELTDKARVTPQDQWHIGSCTKAMTATVCAMLIEQGKIKWDTTIGDVFPELRDIMRPEYRAVTMEQLLTNRGGVPSDVMGNGVFMLMRTSPGTPRELRTTFVKEILKLPPDAPPGTKFIYSNSNFVMAGAMVERLTGQDWEALVQKMLFDPLGMKSAGFGPPGAADEVDQPRGHVLRGDALAPMQPGPFSDNPPAFAPAGTVHCSLEDWAKFASQHIRGDGGDGSLLLKPETFKKLHTPPPDGESYACGWGVHKKDWGGTVLAHAGSNTMWYCVAWLAPQKNVGFLVTTNCAKPDTARATDEAGELLKQYYFNHLSGKAR